MATPSVSFRISRSAKDLASTLHLLSQRLVQLEQRLSLLEAVERQKHEEDPALNGSLDNAERLLLDCRSLLEGALQQGEQVEEGLVEDEGLVQVTAFDEGFGEHEEGCDDESEHESAFAA
ncbi:MAG: hypothetical protein ACKOZT_07360 [Cyanobium sp.]